MKNNDIKSDITLDSKTASQILEKVFEKTETEPNTVPLDVLTSYSSYRQERFSLQRTILVIVMVLFLLLPLLFISPSFTLESKSTEYTSSAIYQVNVDSFLPVSRVTATIGDRNIPVYEADSHVYSIEPSINGRMKVTVTLVNRQQVTQFITVGNVDTTVPVLVSSDFDNRLVYLYLSDSDSGIDFQKIDAVDLNGNHIKPVSYDEASGQIVFSYPENTMNVYIPDHAGNTLQLILSLK